MGKRNVWLAHHGIKGQKWGVRNGPPYPLDSKSKPGGKKVGGGTKSTKEKGKTACNKILAKAGKQQIHDEQLDKSVEIGKNKTKELLAGNSKSKDLAGVTNPGKFKNNCKDVAEATLKRWLGVDPGAVAGEKSVVGDLHDFVERKGYNKSGVVWLNGDEGILSDPSGHSAERVIRQILKNFKDGDCGMIGIKWDKNILKTKTEEDGHAFNWLVNNGKVIFVDDQPDPPLTDAIQHFALVQPNSTIDVAKITKEAFDK